MSSTTNPKGLQQPTVTTTSGGEDKGDTRKRRSVEVALWVFGLLLFVFSCFLMHAHPQPYPIDLATTEKVQSIHLWPWVNSVIEFPSTLNDPIPSIVALGLWFFGLLIIGIISRLKGKDGLSWFQAAVILVLTVMTSSGVNVLVDELVARPRPNPHTEPIHLYTKLVPFPTYPSGHTEHDIAYYGFLLYLSFTRPVREWRYRWIFVPLQIYAVFDMLSIGYSRVLEGDHWVTDVLGGYLEGFLLLFFFIFIYRWTTNLLAHHLAKKKIEKSLHVS